MILYTNDPGYYRRLGWTVESCERKMSECRKYAGKLKRDDAHRPRGTAARRLNAGQYKKYKYVKALLSKGEYA